MMRRIKEAILAESVLVGVGDAHKYINIDLPKTSHIDMYLFRDFLWFYNKKEGKWSATSTANLRLIVPIDDPKDLIDEIYRGNASAGTDKKIEHQTASKADTKSRLSRPK